MSKELSPAAELSVMLTLAGVHFVNLLDFMMVMPLGPDFAQALGIPMSHLGIIGGSYTAAAMVVGIAGSVILDRFERRFALTLSVVGLGFSTLAGAFAQGTGTLVLTRVFAGSFGGVAATLCYSIVADLVHESRRGRATALVASGFSLASILGLPAGLLLARRGGWHMPFLVVGALGLLLAVIVRVLLPEVRGHLDTGVEGEPLAFDGKMFWSFTAFGCAILGNFLLVPNLSAYLQFNMGFPRDRLGLLYLFGGGLSLITMRLAGVWVDRSGAFKPVLVTSVLVSAALTLGAFIQPPILPPVAFFALFMGCNAARWVSVNALATRVPPPSARARYLSAQNGFSHGASAAASFASAAFLQSEPTGRLIGMPALAATAAVLGLLVPAAVFRLEKLVPPTREAGEMPLPEL